MTRRSFTPSTLIQRTAAHSGRWAATNSSTSSTLRHLDLVGRVVDDRHRRPAPWSCSACGPSSSSSIPATDPGFLARRCAAGAAGPSGGGPAASGAGAPAGSAGTGGVVSGMVVRVPWITLDGHRRREFDCPHREADAAVTRLEPDLDADRRRSAPGVFQHGRRQAEGRRLGVQRRDLVERVVELAVRLGAWSLPAGLNGCPAASVIPSGRGPTFSSSVP